MTSPTYVVGYDGSDAARAAARFALDLAPAQGANVVAVHVGRAIPLFVGTTQLMAGEAIDRTELEDDAREAAERMLASIDVDVERRVIMADSPSLGLQIASERDDAALLVLGATHRSGIGRALPGSVVSHLLHGARCPVAVVPADRAPGAIATIGVAFDGSSESAHALAHAERLATALDARIVLVAAVEPLVVPGVVAAPAWVNVDLDLRRHLEARLREASERISVRVTTHVLDGRAGDVLGDLRDLGVDLLVIGSRGYGPVRSVLLGSTSRAVIESARQAVLVVPRSVEVASDGETPAEPSSAV